MSILIKNGRVITATEDCIADVFIEGEQVKTIGKNLELHAVRLVVLSTDLRIRDGQVHLRRPFIVTLLNAVFATIVGVHMVLMCVMAVTAPGPTWLKVVVILAVACVYCFLYYGWSLYTSRPQQVIAKHGHEFDALCIESAMRSRAEVRDIASH